ncbi:type II secretion system protein GspD [Poriferisphaera sp. WC338]|uniref:type II secretion system protein GspD n=1 Tax=Poriferisphaera sp. WC338 TaxID=3425129 RepID=UPI003D819169
MICTGGVHEVSGQVQEGLTNGGEPPVVDLFNEGESDAELQGQHVAVGDYGVVDLHVKDLDLTKVLQLLSIQSQRNIIASRNVAGSVSADLYGVDFYEALEAILDSNGFGYRENGNFIYVYTKDELKTLEEADRVVETKIVHLNYLNGQDAAAFVEPLLSSAGSVTGVSQVADGFEATVSDGGGNSFSQVVTLVIRDYEENLEQIFSLLEQLDARPAQVLIESWILEASLEENNEFGVDFAIFTDVSFGDFTKPLDAVNDIINGTPASPVNHGQIVTSQVGQTQQLGGAKVALFGNDFSVFVRALDQVTDTTVLAKPQVMVLNRQRANLLVGQRLGYLSTTQTETSTTQTVEFLNVGTQLMVRPFISADNYVRMEIKPSVSEGSTRVEAGAVIPTETTNEMTSNVMVRSGQTVVLGGFFKESNQIDRRQIPGMGDIPIAGAAFKGQDDTINRNEVIFMIRPTVVKDKQLVDMGNSALDGVQKAIMGSRDGLLPFSQSKMSAAYLRDARDQLARGNTEKAQWAIDAAIYIDPTSVEAMRMKEQLTGERMYYKADSILDQAVDSMINAEVQKHSDAMEESIEAPVIEEASEVQSPELPAIEAAVTTPTEVPTAIDGDIAPELAKNQIETRTSQDELSSVPDGGDGLHGTYKQYNTEDAEEIAKQDGAESEAIVTKHGKDETVATDNTEQPSLTEAEIQEIIAQEAAREAAEMEKTEADVKQTTYTQTGVEATEAESTEGSLNIFSLMDEVMGSDKEAEAESVDKVTEVDTQTEEQPMK